MEGLLHRNQEADFIHPLRGEGGGRKTPETQRGDKSERTNVKVVLVDFGEAGGRGRSGVAAFLSCLDGGDGVHLVFSQAQRKRPVDELPSAETRGVTTKFKRFNVFRLFTFTGASFSKNEGCLVLKLNCERHTWSSAMAVSKRK